MTGHHRRVSGVECITEPLQLGAEDLHEKSFLRRAQTLLPLTHRAGVYEANVALDNASS